ncbi:MAG: type II CRISPR-associated endonuclease Cas1 [Cyclobacteriaceae bacterium]|nr:type II CRISPR-associated endonuclease Cas1 [Cyclobacteriaceae bacterium]UYN86270.1 MAG: type II CRISPR-associated endonuclease Cas1 [Cyclobacteriaceae bacterium]
MVKRTLYFGNPAYLSTHLEQLVVRLPEVEKNETLPDGFKQEAQAKIPIEDIGVVILDHQQIIITQALMAKLLANNTAFITCDNTHHPSGLMLNLSGHTLQATRFKDQLGASQPLLKQLWQQTIKAKIKNQALLLGRQSIESGNMHKWAKDVLSGDPDNLEARAAAYYWKNIFPEVPGFRRERGGIPPNNLLNYAYAIIRAIVARSLVGSGLLPTLGIHHHNKYNHYCLADDIMEPYRPFADAQVLELIRNGEDYSTLTPSVKKQLLMLPSVDAIIKGERSPLQIAVQRTTASLAKCFEGTDKKILYPELPS